MRAKIICDASYNKDLFLGGYSGGILIIGDHGDWTELYHGIAADAKSSNEAEMLAIAMGAKRLGEWAEKSGVSLTSLEIYTDSMVAQRQFSLFENGRQHNDKYSLPLAEMEKHLSKITPANKMTIHHVKAHVAHAVANPLERLHNLVDQSALSTRWMAQNHIFNTTTDKSKHYGAVIPLNVRNVDVYGMKQLAYFHAKQGLIARTHFVGGNKIPESHPFIQGIAQAAKEMNVEPEKLMNNYEWGKNENASDSASAKIGCRGMDRVLVRHHMKQAKLFASEKNFSSSSMQFAGVASRLMFGPQPDGYLNGEFLTGRKELPSAFVINMFNVKSGASAPQDRQDIMGMNTPDWINAFSNYVKIPVRMGVNKSIEMANIPQHLTLKNPRGIINKTISDTFNSYSGLLNPDQMFRKTIEVLGGEGFGVGKNEREKLLKILSTQGLPVDRKQWLSANVFIGYHEKKIKINSANEEQVSLHDKPVPQTRISDTLSRRKF
jgi:ribonuclease HI